MNIKQSFFCSNFGSVCVLSPANLKRGWVTNFDVIVFASLHTNVNLNNKETANNPPWLVGCCYCCCCSFVPTGLLLHAAVLFKVTLDTTHKSVPGFLWCDGLSIVINNFLHEQRDKPSLISSTLQRGSANQIFHSLSGWLLIANFVLSFLFPSFKYS